MHAVRKGSGIDWLSQNTIIVTRSEFYKYLLTICQTAKKEHACSILRTGAGISGTMSVGRRRMSLADRFMH